MTKNLHKLLVSKLGHTLKHIYMLFQLFFTWLL